jgi:hypothetical protein
MPSKSTMIYRQRNTPGGDEVLKRWLMSPGFFPARNTNGITSPKRMALDQVRDKGIDRKEEEKGPEGPKPRTIRGNDGEFHFISSPQG